VRSYALCADGSLSAAAVVTPPRAAAAALAASLSALVDVAPAPGALAPPPLCASHDTWVYLTAQAGFAGLRADERMLAALLAAAPPGGQLRLATPYCNLTPALERALGGAAAARVTLLTAAPEAHGFAGAAGAAALVPDAYGVMVRSHAAHVQSASHLRCCTYLALLTPARAHRAAHPRIGHARRSSGCWRACRRVAAAAACRFWSTAAPRGSFTQRACGCCRRHVRAYRSRRRWPPWWAAATTARAPRGATWRRSWRS
jgi:hypothetical protein